MQVFEIAEGFAQRDSKGGFIHAHAAGGLIHQVDGFIGHVAVRDIASRVVGRGLQGLVTDLQVVVLLVLIANAAQDLDGLLRVRFFHKDRLEAAFQRGIAFDVFAIFIQGGGSDNLDLPPTEGRFKDIGCIHAAAGRARAHQHV